MIVSKPARPERQHRLHAAVVELDPLPDPVRPAAQDDDLAPVRGVGFVLGFVGGVVVGASPRELPRASVDHVDTSAGSPIAGAATVWRPRRSRAGPPAARRQTPRASCGAPSPHRGTAGRRTSAPARGSAPAGRGTTGRCPVARWSRPIEIPASSARLSWYLRSVVGRRTAASSASGWSDSSPVVSGRRARHPPDPPHLHPPQPLLPRAAEVRPMAMVFAHRLHLHARACRPRSGNFSKAKRGNFTTT